MLVLSRRVGEALFFPLPGGESMLVRVCGVSGDKVRLGIAAPPQVNVVREELLARRVMDAAQRGRLSELEQQIDAEEDGR